MVQMGVMLGTVVIQVLVSWCAVVAEVFLGVSALEPPEAHVNGLEDFFHHGLVGDACGSGVVALNGIGGLRPAHFEDRSVERGYRGLLGEHNVSAGATESTGEVEIRGVVLV